MPGYTVAILGGGSVGLCLAVNFATAGARVHLLVRQAYLSMLSGKSITVSGMLGAHVMPADRIAIGDASNPGEDALGADMLCVTTKAYDVEAALTPFAGTTLNSPVLLLQNGSGSAEVARGVLGPNTPIYSSAMMIGMIRQSPTQVAVTAHSSPIRCGPLLGDDAEPLKRLISVAEGGFLPMEIDPSIRETIAFKLLFNSCLNPTGALTGQTYGELLSNPASRELIVGLADETLAAFAKAYDYRPADNGRDYVDGQLSQIVFPRAEGHKSSMLQDLQAGRKTEIDFLNGAIVDLSARVGLEAIRHASIGHLIRAFEKP